MGLTFPWPVPPGPGEVLEILPGVYSLRMPLPLQLDHVNLWVLEDRDGLVLVDTGIADETTPVLLRQALTRLGGKPVTRLVVTHHHPDHCGLADEICEEHGAELLMSAQAYEAALVLQHRRRGTDASSMAAALAKHGLVPEAQRFLADHQADFDLLKPAMPPRFTELADGDRLTVGGRELRVIFGQGHAPDHVCLYAPGAGEGDADGDPDGRATGRPGPASGDAASVGDAAGAETGDSAAAWAGDAAGAGFLISGDMLLPTISTHVGSPATWLPGNPVAEFQKSVGKLAALPADTLVLPSHGAPFYGARERVVELERHHEQRCLAMLAALGEPRSAAQLLAVIFRRELDPLQLMFAMNEAIAHLEYMTDRGDVDRSEDAEGVIRYVRRATQKRAR